MEIIKSSEAPQAIGPYSQAVKTGGFVFLSGQIPLKASGEMESGDIKAQTLQVMNNLLSVLKAAGADFSKVVKTTIYLADMNDFAAVNEVYGSFFGGEHKPARATVQVSRLPKDVKVEIDCIAAV